MSCTPYLFFNGNANEAFEYYRQVFRARDDQAYLLTYGEAPGAYRTPIAPDLVCNAVMSMAGVGIDSLLMLGDVPAEEELVTGNNVMMVLGFRDQDEQRQVFEELAADGEIVDPLNETFFNELYGIVKDKFGITWQLAYGVLGL